MTTDTTIHLGQSWDGAEQLITRALWFVPRIGERVEILVGVDDPRPVRVLDVKHTLVGGLQLVELLTWPEDLIAQPPPERAA